MERTLYTTGYGKWPTKHRMTRMTDALTEAGVTLIVDIRISPCASNPQPGTTYSARDWHLQDEGGIQEALAAVDVRYEWIVELGNPQKNDRTMTVMKSHLDSHDDRWPAVRGLKMLAEMVKGENNVCCLLCACADFDACHRKLVANAFNVRHFENQLRVMDIPQA